MENGTENNEGANQNNENKNAEELAAQELAALAAAEAAKNTPTPITDEILFSEITKRYPTIKSKEDMDSRAAFDETQFIKPKNEVIRKLNDWQGEPELYLKVAKLEVEKLNNKSAIIQDLIIKEGLSERVAEIKFNKQYGAAFQEPKDKEGNDNPDFNEDEKLLADNDFNKAAVEAKKNLSQWKASSEETGFRKPDPQDEAKRQIDFQKQWVEPVKAAIGGLQKISMDTKYKLSDNTEVTEPFVYSTENPETKKVVEDLLTEPNPNVFIQKLWNQLAKDETGKISFTKMAEALTKLIELDDFVGKAMSVGASKGVANHLANVKPGNLSEKRATGSAETKGNQALADAMNTAYINKLNNK